MMDHWLLDSIEVNDGFLDRLSLQFPRKTGLICIIGPRGSGKSTLIEAIRYGMGERLDPSDKDRFNLIESNIGPSKITLRTVPDRSSESFTIHRRPRQTATITKANGEPLPTINLESGTFLRLDAYGYKEIENIAQEQLGPKRRLLIDELLASDYDALRLNLSDLRRQLQANADAIRNKRKEEKATLERIEELRSSEDKLKALPEPDLATTDAHLVATAELQRRHNRDETIMLQDALKHHASIASELQKLESMTVALEVRNLPKSENLIILQAANAVALQTANQAKPLVDQLRNIFQHGTTQLEAVLQTLNDAHNHQEALFQNLQSKNTELSQRLQQRDNISQEVRRLREKEEERERIRVELDDLLRARNRIRGTYLLEREHCSNLREDVTSRLQKRLEKRVRIGVHRNADNSKYDVMLLEGIRGARVRPHDEIKARLLEIRPEDLAEMVHRKDVAELNKQSSLGEERCRKILDSFHTNVDPFEMEVVEFEDRIAIELNVGTECDPHFKDAKDLSSGQKCTALLPLLLARRDVPLVIDQPEDNLDNHYIYETVVKTISKLKTQRQMIFVTHNANIPVLGDADLVVVMNSDGRRGFISKVGTVDECRIEIIELLEGGKDAFDERRKRYEQ